MTKTKTKTTKVAEPTVSIFAPKGELAKSIAERSATSRGVTGGMRQRAVGRSDEFQVNPFDIVVKEGFNVRNFASPELIDHIDTLARSIAANGVKRALKVRSESGKFILVDGECRMRAVIVAIENYGAEVDSVPVKLTDRSENDADATLGLIVENSGLALDPLAVSEVLKRLRAYGWSDDRIAERTGMSKAKVVYSLALGGLPESVKNMVTKGVIAPTLALEIARRNEFDEKSTMDEINEGAKQAAAKGKARVTSKVLTGDSKVSIRNIINMADIDKIDAVEDAEATVCVTFSATEWAKVAAFFKLEA